MLDAFPRVGGGIRCAATGNFSGLPETPTWDELLCLAVMIDGYEVLKALTDEHIEAFHTKKEADYVKTGAWSGSVLDLWVILFYYNRKNHWNEGYGFGEGERNRTLAISCYQALPLRLMTPAEISGLTFIATKM